MRASRGYGYARAGRDEAANTVLEQLAPTPRDTDIGATHIARIYAGLGEFDRAFELLDDALAAREPWIIGLDRRGLRFHEERSSLCDRARANRHQPRPQLAIALMSAGGC